MGIMPVSDFDNSWLWRRTSISEYFDEDGRQQFVASWEPELAEWVAEFKRQIAEEQAAIAAIWLEGDEFWEWRNERRGPKLEPSDSIGEMGIAIMRAGRIVAVWKTGTYA